MVSAILSSTVKATEQVAKLPAALPEPSVSTVRGFPDQGISFVKPGKIYIPSFNIRRLPTLN